MPPVRDLYFSACATLALFSVRTSTEFDAIGMNDDLTILVQGTNGLLEVALADTEQAADQRRIALVADRQGTVVFAQLGEDLRVQAGGRLLTDRLQAQADLAVGANFLDEALFFFTGAHELEDFV